jgi:hypothetical protein
VRVVLSGVGAAGTAIIRLLLNVGVGDVLAVDRAGTPAPRGSTGLDDSWRWVGENTNRDRRTGGLHEALVGADVFIGVSAPNILTGDDLAGMNADAIVFALANPDPEVDPFVARQHAAVVATGRSDLPNQINNVLVFPGFFRGLLDAQARTVSTDLAVAAARAIAAVVKPTELNASFIIPSVFNPEVAPAVAAAVRQVADASTATGRPQPMEPVATAGLGRHDLRRRRLPPPHRVRRPAPSTAAVLRDLQRAHLLAVPFENLDINPIGTPIVLSADALFHKVVVRRRGGFCYELNGLFAIALEQLGFDVTRVAGQVSRGDGKFGPEFDHLALVVRVDGATHLADVGFGDFSLEPLDLSVRGPQEPRGAAARRMASTRPTTRRGSRGSRRGTTAGRTATASDCSRADSRTSPRSAAGSRPTPTRTSARSGSARSPPPTGA